jgi:hypothetical protein
VSHEHDHAPTSPHCLNCGAELEGKFCHVCGQKATAIDVHVHDFVHEATHEFLHLDGKIVRTVKLLVGKPGMLTNEFLIGRRQRYISPLRVYLTCSLLFFLIAAIVPSQRLKVSRTPAKLGSADSEIEKRIESGLAKAQRTPELLGQAVMHNLPRVMFVLMPLFALLTWAFYRKQQPFYIPHLYYAVHFHAFVFLVAAVYALVSRVIYKPVAAMVLLAPMPYHFVALRRVFGGSRAMTFVKGMAVGAVYWLLAIAALFAVTFWILIHL